jgi:hypothetical protein
MSSFIISMETMNNIINGIFWDSEFKNYFNYFLERNNLKNVNDFQELGNRFFILNTKATNYRYDEKDTPINFIWKENPSINKFQVLKSMNCLKYQCSEGEIDKEADYILLGELIKLWNSYVLETNTEYIKAKWD